MITLSKKCVPPDAPRLNYHDVGTLDAQRPSFRKPFFARTMARGWKVMG